MLACLVWVSIHVRRVPGGAIRVSICSVGHRVLRRCLLLAGVTLFGMFLLLLLLLWLWYFVVWLTHLRRTKWNFNRTEEEEEPEGGHQPTTQSER